LRRAAILLSGGKDSVFALHISLLQGFDIATIVTFKPRSAYPWFIHAPFVEYTSLQLRLMSLEDKHRILEIRSEDKEEERKEILKHLENLYNSIGFDYLIAGVIASDAQRTLLLEACDRLGTKLYTPFWGKDPAKHLLDIIRANIEFIITSVNAWGLHVNYLGKIVDLELALNIIELSKRYGFNPSFEGGEAETFVIYTPLFGSKRLCIKFEKHIENEYTGFIVPKSVHIC
jgi:uncharacterized protein (TIGR00290 family)